MVHNTHQVFAGIMALFICVMAGCSQQIMRGSPGSISSLVRADEYGLEVASTATDQAREEILNSPTVFQVSQEDDTHCWERARFFLENYSGASQPSVVSKVVGQSLALSSNPSNSAYLYEVSKSKTPEGFSYQVSCTPLAGGDGSQATLNAGNFARFVRDGVLEVSLLRASRP